MSVVVVSTGGTIASTEDAGGDASPDLTGADLVAAVPGLDGVAEVTTHEFSSVPSPHLTVEDMADLAALVRDYGGDPEVEGVVVTQGTDTLEETAYFVDRCYGGETPVVFTGAMRNPSLASPDGPGNLLASVRVAAHPGARDLGVLVCFNDRVLAARHATKTHSMNLDTFRAPEFGPLGTVDEDRVAWSTRPAGRSPTHDIDRERLTNDVRAVTVTADMPEETLRGATDAAAVCLATTGAGHVPPGILPALGALADAGVPLVATTRCPEGRLARHTYDFPGSEASLRELGCYFADRNLQKTRIETVVALAADALEGTFDRPA